MAAYTTSLLWLLLSRFFFTLLFLPFSYLSVLSPLVCSNSFRVSLHTSLSLLLVVVDVVVVAVVVVVVL